MAIKNGNKVVPITLTPFHLKKLAVIRGRVGLSNTAVVQRWIEQFDLFESEKKVLDEELSSST